MKTEERHAQLELCIPYVFGRLNPGNRKQFEAHLDTGCVQCKTELAELYEATALLPLLLKQEFPPGGLRQRLLSRLSSKRPQPQRGERPPQQQSKAETPVVQAKPRSWYLTVSMVMGALIILALLFFLNDQLTTTGDLEKRVSALQADLQLKQEVISILQAKRVETVTLVAVEPGAALYGILVWDPEKRRAALLASQIQALDKDKQYQLWLMKGKRYIGVGVFDAPIQQADLISVVSLPVGNREEIEEFAVTVEQRGGNTQPSGPMQLRGTMK